MADVCPDCDLPITHSIDECYEFAKTDSLQRFCFQPYGKALCLEPHSIANRRAIEKLRAKAQLLESETVAMLRDRLRALEAELGQERELRDRYQSERNHYREKLLGGSEPELAASRSLVTLLQEQLEHEQSELAELRKRDGDVRALDEWAREHEEAVPPVPVFHKYISRDGSEPGTWTISVGGTVMRFATPDEARAAAAAWAREQKKGAGE